MAILAPAGDAMGGVGRTAVTLPTQRVSRRLARRAARGCRARGAAGCVARREDDDIASRGDDGQRRKHGIVVEACRLANALDARVDEEVGIARKPAASESLHLPSLHGTP
jgi:hypothetical protein